MRKGSSKKTKMALPDSDRYPASGNDEGPVSGIAAFGRDITGLKPALEALQESESILRSFFDSSGVMRGIVEVIAKDDVLHIAGNAATAAFIGLNPDDLKNKRGSELDEPRDILRMWISYCSESRKTKKPVTFEYLDKRGDNEVWLLVTINYLGKQSHGYPRFSYDVLDITGRKRAEEALHQEQVRTSTILVGIADTFYSLDENWRFTLVNPAAEKAPFGKPAEELLGRVIWDLYPDLVGTRIQRHYLDAAEKFTHEHYEAQSPLNGRWYEVFMQGRKGGVDVYMRDINDRKRTEAALRESEARLSLALQASDAGTWDWDVLTGKIVWSPPLFSLFGIDPGLNASFDTWTTVLHPEDRAVARTRIEEALARHGVLYSVYRIIRPDREVRWINARGQGVYDPSGQPVRMYGICIDITRQRNAEEALLKARDDMESRVEERTAELKEALGALETERRRFFDVLEALPVYVCLLDVDYHMPFANRYFRETFMEPAGRRCHEFLFNRTEPCEICESYTVMKTRAPHHWFWTAPNGRDYDIYDYPFTDSEGSTMILEMGIDITEQKKSEKALQKANAYNRSLIEANLDPLVTISPDGTISDVNEATILVTGFSRAELVGTDFSDYFTEPEQARAGYERVFREGAVTDYALGIRHRDGHVTPVLYNATVYRDTAGNIIGVFASARDITERKKTEEMLRKAHDLLDIRVKERTAELVQANVRLRAEIGERRKAENTLRETSQYLENLINYANAPIIVWDPDFRITLFNHAFEYLTDRTAAEVIGNPLDILLPRGCLEEVMALIRKTVTGERWESVEIPILHKKGDIRTVLWNSASIFGADGKTIISIIAQGQDITDRKKIESEYRLRASEYAKMNVALKEEIRQRKESDATLKNTLSLLNASLESTADGIYVIDHQGMITGYNKNFMSMWHIPSGLLESGKNELVMDHILPQLKDPKGFLASIKELQSHSGRESFDMIEFNDGKIFERYSKPQKIGDSVVGRVWSYRDITDRKHAEEKLVASLQEKEVLLREIHHRVKNNLQLISGLLDMTRMRSGDESTNEILTDMMLKIQTMAQIHTRLYESKQFGKVSLTGQIRDQIAGLSNIYSHKGHEISCELHSQDVFLPVDQAIPCALVVNEVLSNAYKHAFKGRKKGTIEISAVQENDLIKITIRDDGIGLPIDFDISRSNSLGLKLIRTLVSHQLKGSLTLKSLNGTEMSMEFPVIPTGT